MTVHTSPARVSPRKRSLVSDLRDFQRDRLGMLLRLSGECGDIGPVRLGPTSTVAFANSAEAAGSVLIEHADDFRKGKSLRLYMRPVIGDGLLSTSGAAHRYQRRMRQDSERTRAMTRVSPSRSGAGGSGNGRAVRRGPCRSGRPRQKSRSRAWGSSAA